VVTKVRPHQLYRARKSMGCSSGKEVQRRMVCMHDLELSDRQGHWFCNACGNDTVKNGWKHQQRYRCKQGCNFDLCACCYEQLRAHRAASGKGETDAAVAKRKICITDKAALEDIILQEAPMKCKASSRAAPMKCNASPYAVQGSGDGAVVVRAPRRASSRGGDGSSRSSKGSHDVVGPQQDSCFCAGAEGMALAMSQGRSRSEVATKVRRTSHKKRVKKASAGQSPP